MEYSIIISGFGGQGALFAGQILAYAALERGRHVTWIPSYGPEMRGGTAHCTVIIGDEPIGAPLVHHPQLVIALNNPSIERYAPLVAPGGTLAYNSSLAVSPPARTDIDIVALPGSAIAAEIGDGRLLNMVMLGALLAHVPVLPIEALARALADHLPAHRRDMLELNLRALEYTALPTRQITTA